MRKFVLSLRLWPTVITVFAFIILMILGVWQIQRLHWKQDLINRLNAQIKQPAILLDNQIENGEEVEFRHFNLDGHFIDKTYYLIARSANGENGFRLISPFIHQNDQTIMIDRGWIKFDMKNLEFAVPTGQIQLTGILRAMRKS
ncbi:MAG: SURF1 family protein, partial [Pseudomonadota bacterium]